MFSCARIDIKRQQDETLIPSSHKRTDETFVPGLFVLYLVKLEDVRAVVLEQLYGVPPCTIPPIDTLTDSCFEYSIIANVLLVSAANCQQQT